MFIEQIVSKLRSKKNREETSELRSRSLIKAISWRAFGTMDTIALSWLISGNWRVAFSIGTFELLTKTFLYYFHERMWNHIKWGK